MGLVGFLIVELLDEIPKSIDATATGTTEIAKKFTIPSFIPTGKIVDAKIKLSYTWADTADGKIRVRNDTDGVDIATKELTGGESSNEENLLISVQPDKLIGKQLGAYVDITAAGGTGETVTLRSITLILSLVA